MNLLELIKNFTDNKSKSQVHMLCYYHDYSTVYVILDLCIHVHIYYHLKTYSRSSAVFNAFLSGVPFVSVLFILTLKFYHIRANSLKIVFHMLEHGVHFRLSEICTKTTFDKHFSKIDSILK